MFCLFKKKKDNKDVAIIKDIEKQKTAKDEAYANAKDANRGLNEILVANGFTVQIYLAAGGTLKNKKGSS